MAERRITKVKAADRTLVILTSQRMNPEREEAIVNAAYLAADRVRGIEARVGSMSDVQAYQEFAIRLDREIPIAARRNEVSGLRLDLPEPEYQSTQIGLVLPRIPGLILYSYLGNRGFRRSLVGSDFIQSNETDLYISEALPKPL